MDGKGSGLWKPSFYQWPSSCSVLGKQNHRRRSPPQQLSKQTWQLHSWSWWQLCLSVQRHRDYRRQNMAQGLVPGALGHAALTLIPPSIVWLVDFCCTSVDFSFPLPSETLSSPLQPPAHALPWLSLTRVCSSIRTKNPKSFEGLRDMRYCLIPSACPGQDHTDLKHPWGMFI